MVILTFPANDNINYMKEIILVKKFVDKMIEMNKKENGSVQKHLSGLRKVYCYGQEN